MNDRWKTKEGKRWGRADRDRATRLFRAHVDTPSNFRAGRSCRIKRQPCYFCVQEVLAKHGRSASIEHLPLVDAHHVNYNHPFAVAWTCVSHHRKIDHGALRVPRRAIMDYTSLIMGPYGISKPGLLRENQKEKKADVLSTEDVPPF